MARLRIGSYNGAYFAKVQDSDLEILLPQVDLIGFQEFAREEDRRSLRKFTDFAYFKGLDSGTPVAWRKSRFDLLDKGSHFLSPKTTVRARGAGPSTMYKKHLTWVKLRDKVTGRIFYFGSCHLVPSIHYPERRRIHDLQTTNIKRFIKSKGNNVIIVGDFNIDAKLDARDRDPDMPFVKFGRIGVHSTFRTLGYPKIGTHGNRLIDYVFYRVNTSRLKPVSQKVINEGLSSDHNAYIANFEVTLTVRKRIANRVRKS